MTFPEAYELLDLPEGSNIQQVRARFSEQYEEYRMQIDNAPTPNLRQRYEKNLALREEAFSLMTGGNSLDDSQDLPSSAPHEEVKNLNFQNKETNSKPVFNQATTFSLADALALLGVSEKSSPNQINTAYQNQKAELEGEYQKAQIENIKQAYLQELSVLEEARHMIDTFLQSKNAGMLRHANKLAPNSKPPTNKKNITTILGLVLVVVGLGIWFYFSKNKVSPENTTANNASTIDPTQNKPREARLAGLIKTADNYFVEKKYQEAKEIYEQALALQPADSSLQHRIVRAQEELSFLKKAPNQSRKEDTGHLSAALKKEDKNKSATANLPVYSGKNWKKKFSEVGEYRDGLYMVSLKEKIGFTDKNGKVVIPVIYERVDWFENTLRVYLNSEWFYIDKVGNRLPDDNHSY